MMLPFKKQPPARTVVIDRLSALTAGQLLVRDTWQLNPHAASFRHAIHDAIVPSTDPLDDALRNYTQLGHTKKPLHQLEFSPVSGVSGNVWHHGTEYVVAVKGMPERIIDHCDLTENEREALLIQFHALSASGNYVIAFANGTLQRDIHELSDLSLNETLIFAGFVCLRVDVTAPARQLVRHAQRQGIHIVVLTGQHPHIGLHIGRQLGIARTSSDVCDARQLLHLSDSALSDALRDYSIITRADGEQKRHFTTLLSQLDPSTNTASSADDLARILAM